MHSGRWQWSEVITDSHRAATSILHVFHTADGTERKSAGLKNRGRKADLSVDASAAGCRGGRGGMKLRSNENWGQVEGSGAPSGREGFTVVATVTGSGVGEFSGEIKEYLWNTGLHQVGVCPLLNTSEGLLPGLTLICEQHSADKTGAQQRLFLLITLKLKGCSLVKIFRHWWISNIF